MHTDCEINIYLYWSVPLLIDFDLNKCLERDDALTVGQEEMILHSTPLTFYNSAPYGYIYINLQETRKVVFLEEKKFLGKTDQF